MKEFILESSEDARPYFSQFIASEKLNATIEETSSMDGNKIVQLIIEQTEHLPAIITAITGLTKILKEKNVKFKIRGEDSDKIEV